MALRSLYQRGDKIGGRYQVGAVHMGGYGEVYLCLDLEEQNRPYALKTLQPRHLSSQQILDSFYSEAATWVSLERHPNIVSCSEVETIDDHPFLFLECVMNEEGEGTDLRRWIQRGQLNLRITLDFIIGVCCAMTHANQLQPGLVHRDLKPENILVARPGWGKITDFGLAKVMQNTGPQLPGAEPDAAGRIHLSNIGGTPHYMSPEQWLGDELDERADIYAVGCILYEMLVGRQPFMAASIEDFCQQHLNAAAPSLLYPGARVEARESRMTRSMRASLLSNYDGRLLKLLEEIVECSLAKRKQERYQSFSKMLTQLCLVHEQLFAAQPLPLTIIEGHKERNLIGFRDFEYLMRAIIYDKIERYDECIADCTRVIEMGEPRYDIVAIESAYSLRGTAYAQLKRYNEAFADFDRSLELSPETPEFYYNRGAVHLSLMNFKEAVDDFTSAIELRPDDPNLYVKRAAAYYNLTESDKVVADVNRVIELHLTDKEELHALYLMQGVSYAILGKHQQALPDLTRHIESEPVEAGAFYYRALCYRALKLDEKGLADFTETVRLDPAYKGAYVARGRCLADLSRFDEALDDLARAIEIAPTDAFPRSYSGAILEHLGRTDEALAQYQQALALDNLNADLYQAIGRILHHRGAISEAKSYFERAVHLQAKRDGSKNNPAQETPADADPPAADEMKLAIIALATTGSYVEMKEVVARYPFLAAPELISHFERGIVQQVPPAHKPAWKQRLSWLRQINAEGRETE
jgi:serine/threonine protein kinase/Flp pilus assembly protein TadD